ncbi:TonB-dependent receptor [Cellvibrio polysaccharolyticus]|uniref:TonB-dependent receptor n=1 Tax=Cellvibrio polysaccharolyticus TaxID=2082724 RepID=A0A928V394_9GAMM|nr:TonB-dependent receptor [Cellvibrio polysaccharolyticus]MBE8717976.1 TonB-dependent receptor [Cellvibrio polysaccharolyticus]
MAISLNKKILSLSIGAAMAGVLPMAAIAQEGSAVEEIVVMGMRSSIETAQDLKRNADTVKDVITASDIGALPDKSVTEALQRVPGVTIERFASSSDPKHYADEGTGVLVRGLDRVRSEINGRDAFSANPWGGLSYEDFPAELLGAVEVVKNQTADNISGGIAGTVNLITRKPFDSNERVVAFSAKANYGDFREEVTPSFSALFADNWETSAGRFGFLLAGSRSEYKTRGDGIGLGNFHSRGVDNTPAASYDEWGTLVGPGKVEGMYDGPCVPNAQAWGGGCGTTANVITAEDAHVPLYEGTPLTGQEEGVTWYTPAAIHMSTAENDRERTGFTTSLQWANNDETVIATLEHINSKASLEYVERQVGQAAQGFVSHLRSSHDWIDGAGGNYPRTFDKNGFLTSGVALGTNVEVPMNYRTRWNYNENTVEDTSFNLVLKPTDRLTLELDYQHIDSEQVVHNYSMAGQTRGGHVANVSPYFLDLRGSRPTIEYLSNNISTPGWAPDADGNPIATEPNLFLASGMEQEEFNTAKADSFKFDVAYEMDGAWTGVRAGVYYSDKDLAVRNTNYEGWSAIGTPWIDDDRMAAAAVNQPHLFERVNFSDFYNGKVLKGNVDSFLFPKMELVKNYADSLRQGCKDGWHNATSSAANNGICTGTYVPYTDKPNRVEGPYAAHNISSSNEKRTEFYVRGDFEFDELRVPMKGNVGLRYVNYELESTGALVQPLADTRGIEGSSRNEVMQRDHKALYDLATGESSLSTVKGTDYDTVLPSLNLSFGVADDVVVRFGVSKGLYYPSLMDTRNITVMSLDYDVRLQDPSLPQSDATNPVIALDNMNLTALASNPYLEPEESVNFDLSTEWYFAPAGSVTVGLFQKKLDNIIRNRQFDLDVAYNGMTYDVSAYGPANTGSGTIRGVEFSYSQFYDFLPGAWSGLGLQFNYTYIDQKGLEDPNDVAGGSLGFKEDGSRVNDSRHAFRVFSGLPLQGYSDQNMNIVGMYEYSDISFRIAYTWRSEYLLTLRESEEYVPAFAKAQGMVDASLYYTINDNWKIGVEGSNLLNDETKTRYQMNQAGVKTDALSFTTDRRYALSVRANF